MLLLVLLPYACPFDRLLLRMCVTLVYKVLKENFSEAAKQTLKVGAKGEYQTTVEKQHTTNRFDPLVQA